MNVMKEKKRYTPPQSNNEQKRMHVRILTGTIIITFIIVVIAIAS